MVIVVGRVLGVMMGLITIPLVMSVTVIEKMNIGPILVVIKAMVV
jgi:hypothetical protein